MGYRNKVRGYRNMLGLTQQQLGEKLGMTKQTYYNKETEKTSVLRNMTKKKKDFNSV